MHFDSIAVDLNMENNEAEIWGSHSLYQAFCTL